MKNALMIILSFGIILALSVMGLTSCSIPNPFGNATIVNRNYKTIDDLIKDAPVIVRGTVESKNEEFVYGDVTFALTQFKVETALRGEVPGTINILQTKISQDPFIKRGDKMLLFLHKYTGPVTCDAYVIRSLYMGQYKIEGTRVIKHKDNKLSGTEVLENIELLESKINTLGYEPKPANSISN